MFEELLKKIANAMDENALPYMVIGGQAVLVYGEPRLTRDIDITVGASLDKLDLVLAIAKEIGTIPLVDPEEFTRKTMVLPCQDTRSEIRVDFIFSQSPFEEEAMKRVNPVKLGGIAIKFASLEDLIIHKVIAGRPRDLEDIRGMLCKNAGVDLKYIRHHLKDFSAALEEPFEQRFEELLRNG